MPSSENINAPTELTVIDDPFPASELERNRPVYMGRQFRFRFHGKAMEYFGIWIVNIVLTVLTLSLYAPWAKVRRLRYFYNNTEFFQRFFDFTGVPSKILVGRLIALGIWGLFALASYLEMKIAAFGGLFIYLAMPWLVRATLRFTSRNSKFGNSRFYFSGTTVKAYSQFFLAALICIVSLGIFSPVAIWLYKRYTINHLYVGQLQFKLNNSWTSYMAAVYVPVLYAVLLLVLGSAAAFLMLPYLPTFGMNELAWLLLFPYALMMLIIFPLIQARIFIRTWNSTVIQNSPFKTDCNQWSYSWIVASNWLVKLFSLGLMSPWAAIRLYRYQIESLSLQLENDPNQMLNVAQQDHSALAEELSDLFDLDISL